MWYKDEATHGSERNSWERWSLPIGNGYTGANVFGRVETERLQITEKTLWTGGPGVDYNFTDGSDAYGNTVSPSQYVKAATDAAFANMNAPVASTYNNNFPNKILPRNDGKNDRGREALGNFQSFAEVYIDTGHQKTDATNYERDLNLRTAVAGVSYDYAGASYKREYFTSYPDNVLVMRLSANQAGALNFTLRPKIAHKTTELTNIQADSYGKNGKVTASGDTITLAGSLKQNGMKFEGQFKVISKDGVGTMSAANDADNDNGTITVANATEVVIIMASGTDYKNEYPNYRTGVDPHGAVTERLNAAVGKGYDTLLARHLADYQEIFERTELDLGAEVPTIPTNELLDANRNTINHYVEELHFQYGRYLLIASSRDDTLPANLQGVWNDRENPDWQSDYHTNVNLQMNYWPAMSTNMPETARSLVDYMESLRKPGRQTAGRYFEHKGVTADDTNGGGGFVIGCSANAMGFTGMIFSSASWTPTAAAWMCQNLWEYYQYTGDKDYLRDHIYPIMREAALFLTKILEPGRTDADRDKLYIAPSVSSEQGHYTVGTTFDQELTWQLFEDTIKACNILGVDEVFKNELIDKQSRLVVLEIGDSGQIKEWRHEGAYNKDANGADIGEPDHRHVSQLVGLYPGTHIVPDSTNKEDADNFAAAKVTLEKRGLSATGWSMGHKMNLFARAQDGNTAYQVYRNMLSNSERTAYNLWDLHPPFQIDGNFGATAGVSEMLLQSHLGYVQPLAALPDEWSKGKVKDLVARGNFEVDLNWSKGKLDQMVFRSNVGEPMKLKYAGISTATVVNSKGKTVQFTVDADDMISFDTVKGVSYKITFPPAPKTPSSVSITTQPTDLSYDIGETIDLPGLVLEVAYDDDTLESVTSGFTVEPTVYSEGVEEVSITYKGFTVKQPLRVYKAPVDFDAIIDGELRHDKTDKLFWSGDSWVKFNDVTLQKPTYDTQQGTLEFKPGGAARWEGMRVAYLDGATKKWDNIGTGANGKITTQLDDIDYQYSFDFKSDNDFGFALLSSADNKSDCSAGSGIKLNYANGQFDFRTHAAGPTNKLVVADGALSGYTPGQWSRMDIVMTRKNYKLTLKIYIDNLKITFKTGALTSSSQATLVNGNIVLNVVATHGGADYGNRFGVVPGTSSVYLRKTVKTE